MVNVTTSEAVPQCPLFDAMLDEVKTHDNQLGESAVHVHDKAQLLNPCPHGDLCGGKLCDTKKGEVRGCREFLALELGRNCLEECERHLLMTTDKKSFD